METVNFIKMHGTGNDFVIIDERKKILVKDKEKHGLALKLCDRHFGIGADGIIFISNSKKNDMKMRIINSDGSEAEMCGNGIRCLALYAASSSKKKKFKVQTLAGLIQPEVIGNDVRVSMGKPRLKCKEIPMNFNKTTCLNEILNVPGFGTFTISAVSMGNPHVIIFTNNLNEINLERLGPAIETHSIFPKKTNVHFVQVLNKNEIKIRTWERGAGITLACGTGATGCAVVCNLLNKTGEKIKVHVPGGELSIELVKKRGTITNTFMTGPATEVYKGSFRL
ncbi:diaminopimelate epimerase [Candidatus Micrarchaeota archaeon]|nr:diaminopimelate epimerase [Candidatus Micrarchaeota archaeon]